jgi:protocatechuate 3,4-dioxygenase beta subunit
MTDDSGHYEVCAAAEPSGWVFSAQPENGQPYFAASVFVPNKPGPDATVVNFDLLTGIVVEGRVTDQATGKRLQSAVVEYYPLFPNPHSSRLTTEDPWSAASSCLVQPDGSYRLVVLPGPGVVCAAASPQDWYASAALLDEKRLATLVKDGIYDVGSGPLLKTAAGGFIPVNRFHALALISPDETTKTLALGFSLPRARWIKGTVVGPDSQPLAGVTVVGLTPQPEEVPLESPSFTVKSLNARGTRTLFFQHEAGLGKTLTIHGDQTEPLRVQLDPCGSVTGRILDRAGKPVSDLYVSLNGKDSYLFVNTQSNSEGRFRLASVPGRCYRLGVAPPRRLLQNGREIEVTAQSGQIKDLGDLLLSD